MSLVQAFPRQRYLAAVSADHRDQSVSGHEMCLAKGVATGHRIASIIDASLRIWAASRA